jgi:enterochelin esterase-like enzyme
VNGALDPSHRSALARTLVRAAAVVLVLALVAGGAVGASRYVWTFWLYRGFPPPPTPTVVVDHRRLTVLPGTVQYIEVRSAAVSATLPAIVYLPPGYFSHPHRRYPSMYLLHGVPGSPTQFVDVGDVATVEAELVAEHRMPPTVLVMPGGPTDFLIDTEWANLARPRAKWMTYVATDVVNAIDHRYRVMNRGSDRAIAGLSEGGYGALNIALHHVGEFRVIESWSGYMWAASGRRFFGGSRAAVEANSPALEVRRLRSAIVRAHTYFWIYIGSKDYEVAENKAFATELTSLGIRHRFFIRPGAHNWSLWRRQIARALVAAGSRFVGGPK